MNLQEFKTGVQDSVPIAAGYIGVSFSFGIAAAKFGISPIDACIMSLTNMTSAGQFAAITLIYSGTTYFELILTQFIINLRYALMSLSLSQKLAPHTGTLSRLLIAYANTDEIFAVAVSRDRPVTGSYMAGLEIPPIIGWSVGALLGAIADSILPLSVRSALGISLYAMFVAIVLPPVKKHHAIGVVSLFAIALRCSIAYIPVFKGLSSGFSIIFCTIVGSTFGAVFFPIPDPNEEDSL